MASVATDLWHSMDWTATRTMAATRKRYVRTDERSGEWNEDAVLVKIEATPFARGNMRACYRAKLAVRAPDAAVDDSREFWAAQPSFVAKRHMSSRDSQVYADDVVMQMYAKSLAEAYNAQMPPPPRAIEFLDAFLIVVSGDAETAGAWQQSGPLTFHMERFVTGDYRKHSNNAGAVGCFAVDAADEQTQAAIRNTPQAFSHFTYVRTQGRCIVVDIQGVGDLLTDPQIHTADGVAFGRGNLGLRGMALFFESHLCTKLCQQLALPLFQLSHEEVHTLRTVQARAQGGTVLSPVTPRRPSAWLSERSHAERWDHFTGSESGLKLIEAMPSEFKPVEQVPQEATLHFLIAGNKSAFRLSAFHLLLAADMGEPNARAAIARLKSHYATMRARRGDALSTVEFLDSLGDSAAVRGGGGGGGGGWTLERVALLSVTVALIGTLAWLWRGRSRS